VTYRKRIVGFTAAYFLDQRLRSELPSALNAGISLAYLCYYLIAKNKTHLKENSS